MKYFVTIIAVATLLAACGGGGESVTPTSSSGAAVTVAGKVTFDYVPIVITNATPRLDYAAVSRREARSIAVALVDSATGNVLATTQTSATGDYSMAGTVGKSVFVRAYARLLPINAATTDEIAVLDNTNLDAQWAIDSSAFAPADATPLTKNLNAGSGWTGTAYNDSLRASGPFAILDSFYTGMQKIVAVDSTVSFRKMSVHWSPNNIAATGSTSLGQIGTSYFSETRLAGVVTARNMYILGKQGNDTDEYDPHVVTHEFGHYLQSVFSRDDSIGGSHGGTDDQLDMRVAFSEGWGNAWSAYALGNKIYADTSGASQASGFSMDISVGTANPGWFKEGSVQKVIWDLSTGSIGFGPVWTAMKTSLTASPALTSAHSFANALRMSLPSSLVTLNAVFNNQLIVVPSDAYGTGETNFGSPAIAKINPIYTAYGALGTTTNICVTNAADTAGAGNKAGEHRYIRMALAAGARTFTVTRDAATTTANIPTDPDFRVYSAAGSVLSASLGTTNTDSATATLAAGNYVLVLTDYTFRTTLSTRISCFDITVN